MTSQKPKWGHIYITWTSSEKNLIKIGEPFFRQKYPPLFENWCWIFLPIKKVFHRFSKFSYIYITWTSSEKILNELRENFLFPSHITHSSPIIHPSPIRHIKKKIGVKNEQIPRAKRSPKNILLGWNKTERDQRGTYRRPPKNGPPLGNSADIYKSLNIQTVLLRFKQDPRNLLLWALLRETIIMLLETCANMCTIMKTFLKPLPKLQSLIM